MARHGGNSQSVISTSLLREGPLFKTGFFPSALSLGLWVTIFISCLEVKGFVWALHVVFVFFHVNNECKYFITTGQGVNTKGSYLNKDD